MVKSESTKQLPIKKAVRSRNPSELAIIDTAAAVQGGLNR